MYCSAPLRTGFHISRSFSVPSSHPLSHSPPPEVTVPILAETSPLDPAASLTVTWPDLVFWWELLGSGLPSGVRRKGGPGIREWRRGWAYFRRCPMDLGISPVSWMSSLWISNKGRVFQFFPLLWVYRSGNSLAYTYWKPRASGSLKGATHSLGWPRGWGALVLDGFWCSDVHILDPGRHLQKEKGLDDFSRPSASFSH